MHVVKIGPNWLKFHMFLNLSEIWQPFTVYKNMSQHEEIRKGPAEYTLVLVCHQKKVQNMISETWLSVVTIISGVSF